MLLIISKENMKNYLCLKSKKIQKKKKLGKKFEENAH